MLTRAEIQKTLGIGKAWFFALLREYRQDPDVIALALEKGIVFGELQIVDSTHSTADANVKKDEKRKDKGQGARDPVAECGVKHSRKVRDEHGRGRLQTQYFYGYKAHARLNAETGLITSLVHTPGNAYDGHELPRLLEKDLPRTYLCESWQLIAAMTARPIIFSCRQRECTLPFI